MREVSITLQPSSSMLLRINSPKCGGFRIGPMRSSVMSVMVKAPSGQ